MINSISGFSKWTPAAQGKGQAAGEPILTERNAAADIETFKREFYGDLEKVVRNPTVINSSVQISDDAFRAMQADPAYREQMLGLIQRDLGSSYAPRPASVFIRIGATAEEYRADSWPVGCDDEYHARVREAAKADRQDTHWQKQKEFQARRRAEYHAQQQAMQVSALKHAADSAWLQRRPGAQAPQAMESYTLNSTAAVLEGFSLWEGPAPD